jgi:hypothetical protein
LIFKGKNVQQRWTCNGVLGKHAVFSTSPNGWTNMELCLAWLKHFDQHTKDRV